MDFPGVRIEAIPLEWIVQRTGSRCRPDNHKSDVRCLKIRRRQNRGQQQANRKYSGERKHFYWLLGNRFSGSDFLELHGPGQVGVQLSAAAGSLQLQGALRSASVICWVGAGTFSSTPSSLTYSGRTLHSSRSSCSRLPMVTAAR